MSRRSAIITLTLFLGLVFGLLAITQMSDTRPRLGLDLQGGFSVILQAPEGTEPDVLEQAVEIMRRRIEALGAVQEPEIAIVGNRTVEVQLPGVTERERALQAVGTTGQLEFRRVLDASPIPGLSPVFYRATPPEDPTTTTTIPGDTTTTTVPGATTTTGVTATTAPTTTTTAPGDTTTTTEPLDPKEGVVLPEGVTWCDEVDQPGCVDVTTGLTPDPDPELDAFLAMEIGLIYHTGPASIVGADLRSAQAQFQATGQGVTGQWVVVLDFTNEGGAKFTEVTKILAGFPIGDPRREFAIVLDRVIQSAPAVAADVSPAVGIPGNSAVITLGTTTDQEAQARDLAIVLRYGSLPVAFEQSSVQSVSATLGADSLSAGLVAGLGGLALVAIAMLLYYRALGLVNVIGLAVFGSLMLVVFSLLGAWQGVTLTLAGVAGVIVAVGITSDSYIVYFERIKEEVHRGRSLRSAIDHGFSRAIRTILTADTVTFAGAVLLFFLAVGSVKGFALALLIATICDVVVAVLYTRPAVALLGSTRLGDGGRFSIRGATGLPSEVAE